MNRRHLPSVSLWIERGDEEIELTAHYEKTRFEIELAEVTGPDGKPFDATRDELIDLEVLAANQEADRERDYGADDGPDWDDLRER